MTKTKKTVAVKGLKRSQITINKMTGFSLDAKAVLPFSTKINQQSVMREATANISTKSLEKEVCVLKTQLPLL